MKLTIDLQGEYLETLDILKKITDLSYEEIIKDLIFYWKSSNVLLEGGDKF